MKHAGAHETDDRATAGERRWAADRGQTQQDFAVGASVFLLSVIFVFAFIPTTLSPTGQEIERDAHRADQLATAIAGNLSAATEAGTLDATRTDHFFDTHSTMAALRANYSLPETAQANVTVETLGGAVVASRPSRAGAPYSGRVGGSATRIVELDGKRYALVVRVW